MNRDRPDGDRPVGAGPGRHPDGGAERLDALAAELRAEAAIESRRRERMVRHRLDSEATLAGVAAGAMGGWATFGLGAAGQVAGEVRAVDSAAVLVQADGREVWVNLSAVEWVGTDSPVPAAGAPPHGSWAAVLEDLLLEEAEIRCRTRTGTMIEGWVAAVGEVVTFRDDRGRASYASPDVLALVSRRS